MKTTSIFAVIIATLLLFSFLPSPAMAGSPQKHRWEGVAIGIGAAILGNALLNNCYERPYAEPAYSRPAPRKSYGNWESRPAPRKSYGHWEKRKVWVPATHKKVWNPAHYNPRGKWVPGKWIRVADQPGYWTKERVWIARR